VFLRSGSEITLHSNLFFHGQPVKKQICTQCYYTGDKKNVLYP